MSKHRGNGYRSRALVFADRAHAGAQLAARVAPLLGHLPSVVLGLPRGGVAVAFEVARALHLPLDVLNVRKLGMPGEPEVAIGAIAVHDTLVGAAESADVSAPDLQALAHRERAELERRERRYRAGRAPLALRGRCAILVDDGLATGYTMLAAIRAARALGAAQVLVAAPVSSPEAAALVAREADWTAFLEVPPLLRSVGEWYRDFHQVEDAEVGALLEQRARA